MTTQDPLEVWFTESRATRMLEERLKADGYKPVKTSEFPLLAWTGGIFEVRGSHAQYGDPEKLLDAVMEGFKKAYSGTVVGDVSLSPTQNVVTKEIVGKCTVCVPKTIVIPRV